jgi:hypothetical protein
VPFTPSAYKLERLIDRALSNPEIAKELKQSDPRLIAQLKAEVARRADWIWGTSASEIEEYDGLEEQLADARRRIDQAAPSTSIVYRLLANLFSESARNLLILSIIVGGITSLFIGWRWILLPVPLGILAYLFIFCTIAYVIYGPLRARYRRRRAALQAELTASLKIMETTDQLPVAEEAIFNSAYVNGVMRALRGAINARIGPLYSTELNITSAPGLDSGLNSAALVTTSAESRLLFMLRNMNGGSIGIAGPRGAGKSTLIQSVCGDDVVELEGRPVLTVFTSAPVEYEARDYLLHLFASVCHRVLERDSNKYSRSEWQQYTPGQDTLARPVARFLLRAGVVLFSLGILVWLISLIVAGMNVDVATMRRATPASVHATSATTEPRASAPLGSPPAPQSSPAFTASTGASASPNSSPSRGAAPPAPVESTSTESGEVSVVEFLHQLGLSAASLWNAGLALMCLGVLLIIVVWIQAPRDDSSPAGAETATSATQENRRPDQPRRSQTGPIALLRRLLAQYAEPESAEPKSRLITEARHWLTEIKFQQSFTTGWSGSLKLALGVGGTIKRARSLAQLQLTLPEVVDGLIRFLTEVHKTYHRIIIGIDELDKIESDEKAERFLNDIKAIFGIRGVFYLISVSENAMSSFERRGLPFRDAFDSSFDDVIAVEYLSFLQSRQLLADRVIGMPIQFQALCYCLSGGLARELIRTCRDLVKLSRESGQTDLASLCQALVADELRSKIRAVAHVAERIQATAEAGDLLRHLYALEVQALTPASIETCAWVLLTRWQALGPEETDKVRRSRVRRVVALAQEAGLYLRYLANVLRMFNNALDEAGFEPPEKTARIDVMARTLQALSVSHLLAASMLDAGTASVNSVAADALIDESSGG